MNGSHAVQRNAIYRIIRGCLDKRAGVSLGMSDEAIDDMCRRDTANRLAEGDELAKKELDATSQPHGARTGTRETHAPLRCSQRPAVPPVLLRPDSEAERAWLFDGERSTTPLLQYPCETWVQERRPLLVLLQP